MRKSLPLTALILLFSISLLAQDAIVVVDGKKIQIDVNLIDPNTIESISVLKDQAAIDAYGKEGLNGVIIIKTKKPDGSIVVRPEPLLIVDGKKSTQVIKAIDLDNIESMSVLKDKSAIEKYGAEGKNGVIEIITKSSIKNK